MEGGLSKKILTRQVNIEFNVEGRDKCPGYLSPINSDSKQGLVLLQEWWGVNENLCALADKFAQKGFAVIVPDVYRGKIATDHEHAGHLLSGLDWPGAVADMGAAAAYLKGLKCQKVGILGFCMGGALTFASLSGLDCFSAGSPYYGVCDLNSFPLKNIKVPVLGQFGENDELKGFADAETARNVEKQGKELGLDITINVHPGAGHAFMNSDRPEAYNQEIAEKSFNQSVEFFQKHLN